MKNLLIIFVAVLFSIPVSANTQDEANFELDQMNARGWRHIGCVNQANGASLCRQKAEQHGYTQSRVQQDYVCNPRVFYSCYGLSRNELLEQTDSETEARGFCGGYVKPATCNSHPGCTWNGSCVPR